jgi:hypothetical protein
MKKLPPQLVSYLLKNEYGFLEFFENPCEVLQLMRYEKYFPASFAFLKPNALLQSFTSDDFTGGKRCGSKPEIQRKPGRAFRKSLKLQSR